MPSRLAALVAGLLFLVVAPLARAQFYAPSTEFHDRAQRRFVVELARVMAWRENQATREPKIVEVTDEISLSADRRTTWKIHWLDAKGKSVRDAEVTYPESALTGGAAWYRDVARQLAPKTPPKAPLAEDAVIADYWAGAGAAQPSRAASIAVALAFAPEKDAAKLAGLLAHAALPSLGGGLSLDSTLLARAAAWLCLAEGAVKAPTAKLDSLWVPILFLSSREDAARAIWRTAAPDAAPVVRGWDFLLTRPSSVSLFAFAADPANRRWAMPMLAYQSARFGISSAIYGAVRQTHANMPALSALHDYGPFLAMTDIGGGRLMDGAWPALSRAAWITCLRRLQPDALDFKGYIDPLTRLKDAPAAGDGDNGDEASVAGLQEAAPLLNLGLSEGTGKLIPVAVVTARDLLNFGWEQNGVQLHARWRFVTFSWGLEEVGDEIARKALNVLDGAEYFFVKFAYGYLPDGQAPEPWKHLKGKRLADIGRLQEIDGYESDLVVPLRAFDPDKAQNARLWVRRCWLRPMHVLHQSCELFFAGIRDEITPTLRRMGAEGGPLIETGELTFFAYGLTSTGVESTPGSNELRLELLAAQPEPSKIAYDAQWGKYATIPPFEAAQELEKSFWRRPGNDLPYADIFSLYVRAHAYDSAKRFYRQMEAISDNAVGFSNDIGPRRFTLALMEGDKAAMASTAEESSSGSYSDMVKDMVLSAAQDDFKALAAQVEGCLERYPRDPDPEDMMYKLRGFLPLIPALRDPASPDHGKALDYFANYSQWPSLQWTLLQNAHLSVEEGVRFLGGKNTDPERLLVVAYLVKDKELFARTYDAYDARLRASGRKWSNMAFVVVHCLRNDLLDVPVPPQQPDLRPPVAETLSQILARKRQEPALTAIARGAQATPKFDSADAFWTYLAKLRKGPEKPFTSREEAAEFVGKSDAAAQQFAQRYPNDPRRWEAQLFGAQMSLSLAQVLEKTPDSKKFLAVCQGVADAPDAPREIKAEARYNIVRSHLETEPPIGTASGVQDEVAAFARDFPESPHRSELQLSAIGSLEESDPAKAEGILTSLTTDANEAIATQAKGLLKMLRVTRQPLELKFKALGGADFDIAQWRGKVVLVDFWATWCGPCMAETPAMVAAYQKLHGKGFEIVGISLDEDQAKVESVTKAKGMVWPQHFDGKGWGNEISSSYGIRSIPQLFLVNKKGMVVDTKLHDNIAEAVEKLLAE